MNAPISTYAELSKKLSKLGQPRDGLVRVFRGQIKDYGSMLPTGLRPGTARRDPVWHYWAMLFAREFSTSPDRKAGGEQEAVWIEAIAQHYGPGSRFLDVTLSVDVALWFALHQTVIDQGNHLVGPPGAPDQAKDIPLTDQWVSYRPWTREAGYLYVFDVPKWDTNGSPPHGCLLDLSSRPILSMSSRIIAQAARLLAADGAIDGGDLSSFYRCEPILVGWPLEGTPNLHAAMDVMFPDPSKDPWYDGFLGIPLTWVVDSNTNTMKLARPLSITYYRYDCQEKIDEISGRAKFVGPNPTYPVVSEILSGTQIEPLGPGKCHLEDATRILLQTPILSWFLTYDSGMWNQAILSSDISEAVETFDPTGCSQNERASLTNVFIEFSPLENTDWHRIRQPDSNVQLLRALWLVWQENRFRLYLFPQKVTAQKAAVYAAGPFVYFFDRESCAFWRCDPGKAVGQKATWDAATDKALFVALSLLRFLSPIAKSDPSPIDETITGEGTYVITIPIRGASARLIRVMETKRDRHWYVPRDPQTDGPFFFNSSMTCLDVLRFPSAVPWPEVDASSIRRTIANQFETSS